MVLKNVIITTAVALIVVNAVSAQDIKLTITQSSLDNMAASLIQAKSLSYGHLDLGHFVDYYNFRPKNLSIDILPNNRFHASIVADLAADLSVSGFFHYSKTVDDETISFYGNLRVEQEGAGFRIVFDPQEPISFSYVNWVSDVLDFFGSGLFGSLPEISTTIQLPWLVAMSTDYFTSSVPTLSSTDNDLTLGFTLNAGPRFVMACNDINQRIDIDSVQSEVGANNFVSYQSPKTFEWITGTVQRLQTRVAVLDASNGKNKYRHWFRSAEFIPLEDIAERRIQLTVPTFDISYRAQYDPAKRVQLNNSLEGLFTGGEVQYDNYHGSAFDDHDFVDPYAAHLINTSVPDGTLGMSWFFQQWSDGNPSQSWSLIVDRDISLTAAYKAHLGTGSPALADTKNQRRLLNELNQFRVMVYESMGDIWVTASRDWGSSWWQEERLNTRQGYASNPTLSNIVYYNSQACGVASWVELNQSGVYELHMQSFRVFTGGGYTPHPVWYGWNGSGERSTSNHVTLGELGVSVNARSGSRPVVNLQIYGSTISLCLALERASSGICRVTRVGDLSIGIDLLTSSPDQSLPYSPVMDISTNPNDICPVIITYPSAYGFSGKHLICYLGSGYDSGLRVVQCDPGTGVKTVLPKGYSESTYSSLQAAVNTASASFDLVAQGDAYNGKVVNLYTKATYGSNPSLTFCYLNQQQPTIMLENVGTFGSPNATTFLKGVSDNLWYQSPSYTGTLSLVGGNAAGFFTREQTPVADKGSMVTRTTVSPARIDYYSGTGTLPKTEGNDLAVNRRQVRIWKDSQKRGQVAIIDLSGVDASVVDSLQKGADICVVALKNPLSNGTVLKQVDSLAKPIAITVFKDGQATKAFSPTTWKTVAASSLGGLQAGDVLKFTASDVSEGLYGYEEISLKNCPFTKEEPGNAPLTGLTPLEKGIDAYPNPFNPSTRLRFTLPEANNVKLAIYDILGRMVAELSDGFWEAGEHTIVWDGRNASGASVASGIYFARMDVTDGGGQISFTKSIKLLLAK